MRAIAVFILLLVTMSVFSTPAFASDITVTFDKQTLQTRMNLSVHQNMTKFLNESMILDASADSALSAAFTSALKKVDPSAGFMSLAVAVWSNATRLNLTITMTLSGVADRKGDITALNTTYRAFNVSANLKAGNLSYNTIGKEYLRPLAEFYVNASQFENNPNATIRAVTFLVNETESVPGPNAANYIGNFTVLDFRSLDVPLDQWNRTYSLLNNTTTWRYTPLHRFGAFINTDELNQTLTRFANYTYDAEIIIPGLAQAEGNILRVDVGSGQMEWIMVGVVVFSLALVVFVQFLYRGRKKAAKLGRR